MWPGKASSISIVLLPFGVSDGPFLGHEALPGTSFRQARWAHLAGIVANIVVAFMFYALCLLAPLPALRLLAEVQLGVAAFSLLPLRPLDAAAFRRHQREAMLLIPLSLIAVIGGYAFRVGLL